VAEVLAAAIELRGAHLLPVTDRLGETLVVLARVAKENRAEVAAEVLGTLAGKATKSVRCDPWTETAQLFHGDHPGYLVILTELDEGAEREAARRIFGPMRVAETAYHKIQGQSREYVLVRERLHPGRHALHEAVNGLALITRSAGSDESALQAALTQYDKVTTAYRSVTELSGIARRVQVSLEANQANLRSALEHLPPDTAFAHQRRQWTANAIEQVRVDVADCQPSLDEARWQSGAHLVHVQTSLSVAAIRENKASDRERKHQEAFNKKITLLGTSIALIQVVFGIVQIWTAGITAEKGPFLNQGVMWWSFGPFGIGILMLVVGLGFWYRQLRRSEKPR
jgi:hypothetical protein